MKTLFHSAGRTVVCRYRIADLRVTDSFGSLRLALDLGLAVFWMNSTHCLLNLSEPRWRFDVRFLPRFRARSCLKGRRDAILGQIQARLCPAGVLTRLEICVKQVS